MSDGPRGGYASYGPEPWHQTSWDWRAAGNFICGGAGGGLIVFAVARRTRRASRWPSLIAGRARARRRRTVLRLRWSSADRCARSTYSAIRALRGWDARRWTVDAAVPRRARSGVGRTAGCAWVAAALALAFVYCQARLLQAREGHPRLARAADRAAARDHGARRGRRALLRARPVASASGTLSLLLGFGALVLLRSLRLARLSPQSGAAMAAASRAPRSIAPGACCSSCRHAGAARAADRGDCAGRCLGRDHGMGGRDRRALRARRWRAPSRSSR